MKTGRARVWMVMVLLVGTLVATGAGLPAGAAPTPPSAAAAEQGVGEASCFSPAPHGFSDVSTSHFANTAVAWLLEAGITTGITPTTYSPSTAVTRAQMAVFLWRNADEPAPTGPHGFGDVSSGSFAKTAIAWLVEAGITTGTTSTTYSPNATITRAQMAVFLHRNAGEPAPTGPHSFGDVPTSSFANTAVAWLVEAGITSGITPTSYSPNTSVTRAQMAVFLWRNTCRPQPSGPSQIATGAGHTCALAGGAVSCWGNNYDGQLSNTTNNGTNTANPIPTAVAGLTNVTAITAGGYHTCALAAGTVSCWGNNIYGQLGNTTNNGNGNPSPIPTAVAGLTNVTAITAGELHTCAVAGTVYCWGNNFNGELGNSTNSGTFTPNPTPLPVAGLTNVTAITAGGRHTCALAAGTVSCWGNNGSGQLGNTTNNGTNTANPTSTPVAGLTNVTAITTGGSHTCALAAGTMSCWGFNRDGQLGNTTNNGTNTANPTPKPVVGLTNVTAITAGTLYTCALADGTVSCWGNNGSGQLGNTTNSGTFTPNPTPLPVVGLTDVTAIAAGLAHACAIADGTVFCWGDNFYGELGNTTNSGTFTPNPTPTPVAGLS